MCMFHNLSSWLLLPILGLIVGLIFAIPISDWLKTRKAKLEFSKRRFVRYDGLIATDVTLKNGSQQSVIVKEIGTYLGKEKQPVEANLAIVVAPGDAYCVSYLNGSDSWYVSIESTQGAYLELKA